MESMAIKTLFVIVGLFGLAWYLYLLFLILQHIGATQLMWFMYWLYIPVIVFITIIEKWFRDALKKDETNGPKGF